jgi:beta-barrel assembly-enhancing protease
MLRLLPFVLLSLVACKSRDGDYNFFSEEEDIALGSQIAARIAADPGQFPLVDNARYPALYNQLENMKAEILSSDEVYHKDEFRWELKVIQNDTIYNAFCTPGGYIYIYTGLLKFVESADELAGIMAHEIAHGDLRHSTDQMTKTYGLQVLANLLTGGDGELLTTIGINLLGLNFSRTDEAEADEVAVLMLNDTSYDPIAFTRFFKRLEARGEGMGALQFLSTHPNPENRIEKIIAIWKETGSKKGTNHHDDYMEIQRNLP